MNRNKICIFICSLFLIFPVFSCAKRFKINEISSPISIHNQRIKDFLVNPTDDNLNAKGDEELSKPNPIHLTWEGDSKQYTVNISENEGMLNPFTITTTNKYYDFNNLKLNCKYYWQIKTDKETSRISTFTCKENKVRLINIDGVTNCRDLGGYKTSDGKSIKQGLIYRTGRFNKSHSTTLTKNITKNGEDTLVKQLGIKTEIDLREDDESCGQAYDGYIPGVSYKKYRMQYRDAQKQPVNFIIYNKETIRRLFEEILSKPSNYPLAFHCSQGTDRAGCIAYTILALCGVDKKDLISDYLLSNFSPILNGTPRKFANIADNYPKTIDEASGSTLIEKTKNVLINECQISSNTIDEVRNILVN